MGRLSCVKWEIQNFTELFRIKFCLKSVNRTQALIRLYCVVKIELKLY